MDEVIAAGYKAVDLDALALKVSSRTHLVSPILVFSSVLTTWALTRDELMLRSSDWPSDNSSISSYRTETISEERRSREQRANESLVGER